MNFLRKVKNLVEINNGLRRVFSFICSTRFYQFLLNLKIKSYTRKIKETKEYNIIIETTNICNAKCIMCPHTKMKRKMETMDEKTFDLIIKKLKKEHILPLSFIVSGFGEPLVDNKISQRITKLKNNFPNSQLKIYTNLSLATEPMTRKLISSGLDEINISFNGFNKENYENVMGLSYLKTKKNIDRLILWRNRLNPNLKIRMSMVLVKDNQDDISQYINYWEKRVDSVSVNRIHTYGGAVKDYSGKGFKIDFSKKTFPCKYLWNTIVIGTEGNIFLCCLDYEGQYNFGNIKNRGILEIFYSPKFEKIRKLHLFGDLKKMKICRYCYTPYRDGVEWWINRLY